MKWPAITYHRATSLADVWAAFAAHGPSVTILAGGQTLLATLAFRLSEPGMLLDITRIPELRGITLQGQVLRIGALTRHVELGRDLLVRQHAPLLAQAVPLIAHPAIRNRGTIGGSLAYADPAAELPACAVALDAVVVAASTAGERRIPASAFFTGLLQNALAPGEIIVAVEIPIQPSLAAIDEVARRSGDYAMAGFAAAMRIHDGRVVAPRLVYFGVGKGPVLAGAACRALEGRPLTAESIAAAQAALTTDLDPPQDLHGPPEMKRHLARVLTARVLNAWLRPTEMAA
jgi:carbon-monoxide dehydrogenase medium subunit